MKSLKPLILIIALLGIIASVFNMVYDGSLSGFNTLWPCIALFGVALTIDKKVTALKPVHQNQR